MAHQVSVFVENKPGRLERITDVLARQNINIRAMTLATSSGAWGVLNLLVDRPAAAKEALCASGHPAALREIVAVELQDQPGGLHAVVALLAKAGLNIENAYGTVLVGGKTAILIIDIGSMTQADPILAAAGVKTLTDEFLYQL